jgi:hypothetical protein
MKKFFKKINPFNKKEQKQNISVSMRVSDRISHIGRKMSKGAADIFRVIKDHAKWGNKQLWGDREKGRHRSGLYHKLFKKKK